MVHVAAEMEREGFDIPLLIGGATTSRVHTAVKIHPQYHGGPTVHVNDASRAVGVVSSLLSQGAAAGLCRRREGRVREGRGAARAEPRRKSSALPIAAARGTNRFACRLVGLCAAQAELPRHAGVRELRPGSRSPATSTGRRSSNAVVGAQARELFADAQAMLQQIVDEDWLQARGVVGLWPAHSNGDDIIVLDEQSKPRTTLHCLRQQVDKPAERPDFCLADFIAPQASGRADWIGAFAVTTGHGCEARAKAFEAAHDDYRAILLKALADRLAEAFAEYLHAKVRRELWAYAKDEPLDNDALIREQYQGIRPAPGYPACPDHSTKRIIFDLLDAPERCGMQLTESLAMTPAASVSGLYFSHPRSQYFVLGRVSLEQVEDYAKRRDISRQEAERWLATVLDYDPE
jgi:5-methyltetrahydrofolate--homocysteine methyltransferase